MPQLTACPSCAEPLEPDDKFCGLCGAELPSPDSLPAGSTTGSTAPSKPPGSGPPAGPEPGPASGTPDAYHLAPPAEGPAVQPPPQPTATDPRAKPPAMEAPGPPQALCVACGVGGVDADGYCEHCGHAQPRPRDHQEQELEGVAAVSDRGLRHHRNEDAFTVSATALPDGTPAVVAVVCDGVSSAYRPDDASAAAAEAANESLLEALQHGAAFADAMHDALLTAGQAVTDLAAEDPGRGPAPHHNAPACTCVSAIASGKVFTVGWIGDSRAYWIPDDRDNPAARLTEDDSWAARMVLAGLMSEQEAYADPRAHAITGWLGADAAELEPHTASFEPDGPGVLVVCTDGLWNYAESAAELASVVPADARTNPLRCAQVLVGVALDGGGHDNVTVAVLPFPAPSGRAENEPA
ncbi:protein phosphatase 2C domain-containing protein [Actinacidiphila oryziradicis]|uniref:protein phosphatase 2C domain-containing protein n=1 Tax=Actinacidiphila oryziradicis TaxID=2571141 RepID=UPI0023F00188|nr:protein phosphatase 2C domain-containing protein [Actinacidiphila oryziradicis]MCW2869170.1 protein phosphatase [Actinacidiphila oryziradicis]